MSMYTEMAGATTRKAGGNRVWCRTCRRSEVCDHRIALREGWPECCGGHTMTIDPPETWTKENNDE